MRYNTKLFTEVKNRNTDIKPQETNKEILNEVIIDNKKMQELIKGRETMNMH